MKKSKILFLGLIVLMMIGGLALASCKKSGSGCEGSGTCEIEIKGDNWNASEECTNKTDDGMECMEAEIRKNNGKDGTYKCDC